ncbi:zf-TFIIB domain-containing protein [Paenibacillus daejeonensis]|uniref:TFIIB-type zinc ribbon-containing protein n=1 Tax=Paenibacillus daejeonensis TaxID=135193 RepID=UPI00037194ED
MKCPVCEDVRMREVQKDEVMIDVCPDCKGVWLDRGELDKLMKGVHEMRQELDSWEQPAPPVGLGGSVSPQQPGGVPSFGNGTPPQQPYGGPAGNPYRGQQPYGDPQPYQGGYESQHGPNGPYHEGQREQTHYDKDGYDKHGYDRRGYDKYGYPYKRKKKKTVLDVFGDLFD